MSEKAVYDVWDKYENVEEINGSVQCYNFLNDIMVTTKGLVIVDHFSGSNYDYIQRVEIVDDYILIYWKDFEQKPLIGDLEAELYGYSTYIYTLCHLRRIKIVNYDGHLFILFQPNVVTIKQAKSLLEITNLQDKNEIIVSENSENFSSKLRFIKDKKIHDCHMFSYPFFSFLIQPKEGCGGTGVSRRILMVETLKDIEKRIKIANASLFHIDEYNYDEIQSLGNRLRTILESIIKYYCLYSNYALPKEDKYGNNVLGDLRKHLLKNSDDLTDFFTTEIITTVNEYSHDTGRVHTKSATEELLHRIYKILLAVYKKIK